LAAAGFHGGGGGFHGGGGGFHGGGGFQVAAASTVEDLGEAGFRSAAIGGGGFRSAAIAANGFHGGFHHGFRHRDFRSPLPALGLGLGYGLYGDYDYGYPYDAGYGYDDSYLRRRLLHRSAACAHPLRAGVSGGQDLRLSGRPSTK